MSLEQKRPKDISCVDLFLHDLWPESPDEAVVPHAERNASLSRVNMLRP
jgi:hypothetical protein